jgi:two-component system nitrate/nitrite response regulator NarL
VGSGRSVRDPTAQSVDVLITAEMRLYREGLAKALAGVRGLCVRASAATAAELLRECRRVEPSLVLLDMSVAGALEAAATLHVTHPGLRIVALGMHGEDQVMACAEVGIAGYVDRDASLADLVATVRSVARGELLCSPRMAARLMRRVAELANEPRASREPSALTRREREVVELIGEGLSNKEIARRLEIELPTVKHHVHNVIEKLGVHSRLQAAAHVRRNGLDPV